MDWLNTVAVLGAFLVALATTIWNLVQASTAVKQREFTILRDLVTLLGDRLEKAEGRIRELEAENQALRDRVDELEIENERLRWRLGEVGQRPRAPVAG